MSSIRPNPPPALPARTAGASAAAPVQAAQRAFFQAALDTAGGPQPRGPSPEPRRVEPQSFDRLPRPGSLLDIRV
jgi:hypothetical protein